MILTSNRSFRYGDGLFETMKMVDGTILFFDRHIARLQKGMQVLKMQFTTFSEIKKSKEESLKEEILEFAQKNNHLSSCKIRLQVFRKGEGEGYIPDTSEAEYMIETFSLPTKEYSIHQPNMSLGLYTDFKKSHHILSNIKTSNALCSVLAGIYAKEQGIDDCLLLNESNNVAEAIGSNFFMVKDKVLYTPSLDQACLDGVMRSHLIEQAKKNRIQLIEKAISLTEVEQADELFLTNVIKGILPIQTFMNRKYGSEFTYTLNELLTLPLCYRA